MNRLNSKRNLVLEKCLHYWPICSTTLVYLERPNSYFMWPKVFHFEETFIEKQMLKFLHKYALTLIWIGKSLLEKYRLNLFCCGMCLSLSQVHWHYLCNALHRHYFVSNLQCLKACACPCHRYTGITCVMPYIGITLELMHSACHRYTGITCVMPYIGITV